MTPVVRGVGAGLRSDKLRGQGEPFVELDRRSEDDGGAAAWFDDMAVHVQRRTGEVSQHQTVSLPTKGKEAIRERFVGDTNGILFPTANVDFLDLIQSSESVWLVVEVEGEYSIILDSSRPKTRVHTCGPLAGLFESAGEPDDDDHGHTEQKQ